MNTNRNYFQTVAYTAAVLLTFSSAAVASGPHAAMHGSCRHGSMAMMNPLNRHANRMTEISEQTTPVGFSETDPAGALVSQRPVRQQAFAAQVSGVTVGFAESDPAATAVSNDTDLFQQPKAAEQLAARAHPRQTGSVNASADAKMPANCRC